MAISAVAIENLNCDQILAYISTSVCGRLTSEELSELSKCDVLLQSGP